MAADAGEASCSGAPCVNEEDATFADDAHPGDAVDFDELLPIELWACVAGHLRWPDRAFFAAACKGFAAAASCASPDARRRHWAAAPEWEAHVTSAARLRVALVPLALGAECPAQPHDTLADLGSVPYRKALEITMRLGGLDALAELVAAAGRPSHVSWRKLLERAIGSSLADCKRLTAICGVRGPPEPRGRQPADNWLESHQLTMDLAAADGHLETWGWLSDLAGPPRSTNRECRAIWFAAEKGHLQFCEAMFDRLAESSAKRSSLHGETMIRAFRAAASGGFRPICELMLARLPETDIADDPHTAFAAVCKAARGGHFELCEWIADTLHLGPAEAQHARARDHLYDIACWSSPEIFAWIAERFDYEPQLHALAGSHALHEMVLRGNLRACEWVTDRFRLGPAEARSVDSVVLSTAAGNGRTDICDWLVKRFGFNCVDVVSSRALYWAAFWGHKEVCVYLMGVLGPAYTSVKSWLARELLVATIAGGHADLCRWAAELGCLGRTEVRACGALRHAARTGRVEVAAWLTRRFGLRRADAHRCGALWRAAQEGHLEFCEWLEAEFDLGCWRARGRNNRALRVAARRGHLDVCEWLADTYRLGPADAKARDNSAWEGAMNNDHRNVAVWLRVRFGAGYGWP